jgi:hypothetical protein
VRKITNLKNKSRSSPIYAWGVNSTEGQLSGHGLQHDSVRKFHRLQMSSSQ